MSPELPDVADGVAYDAETNTYRATFGSTTTTPSVAVVEMITSIYERDPTDLTPLGTVIDPDALDQFLQTPALGNPDGERKVEFTFEEHSVTLLSYGLIKVQPVTAATGVREE